MRIPKALFDEIVAHALEDVPNECCGMIAARDGEAVEVHRAGNASRAPRFAYEMDPMEQYRIQTGIEDAGLDLGAIYHSHPKTRAEPSQTDINLALLPNSDTPCYPGTLYIIVGLEDRSAPQVRAWLIDARDQVTEAPLEVV
jgi:[CysO sulfur-carrier protein]-S-L-cysteine hydrolase